ncbi:helix-turn-helix transcriptional regulator [Paenibacillus sp.]|uniref:helix-turn-helix transcriptional regulator n=1 Tax=Paenibacillus sp. TaxID=58172 RepID=UPI0028126F90|nr:helix-turn-helix transcriptional regulator [Paenibacillus sp.]
MPGKGNQTGGAVVIELSARQMEIANIVLRNAPITGDQIAERLGVTKPTIRSDLSVLVMVGIIDAKPKVGYFPGKLSNEEHVALQRIREFKVKDVHGVPVVVRSTTTVHDAILTLFLEDVGTLIVVDQDGLLEGMVSRKDFLKVTLGSQPLHQMPVSLVMTRQPKIVTVAPEDPVVDAARKMIQHEIDSLPVTAAAGDGGSAAKQQVVGRITKTHITKLFLEMLAKG